MIRALLIAAIWPSSAIAGPWTKNLGEAYLKISENVFIAGEYVDPRAGRAEGVSDASHRSFSTAIYGEVGVFDRLHALLYLPWTAGVNSYQGSASYLSLGFGDLNAGLQWSPDILPFPAAIRAEIKVPLYDIAQPKGYDGVRFPARGDGQIDATLWLSAGTSFSEIYLYGELGHRFRTEAYVGEGDDLRFADSFVAFGQIGWTTPISIIVAGSVNCVVPYAFDDATKGYLLLGASLFAPIGAGFALEAGVEGTAWARASSRGVAVSGGVSYRL